ncbi:PREDICTED: beta-catenin-interacting protein 1 [Bison bison bison]|uniref:Beta-catenin-interacting protein 1 n=1 Tax=Bison bison bison TaxID=43346 RepID=A0A6P3I199_BISBB|nr:PREDICTED: beta-catenin-interacting protein 1 [Bison bison bison]
MNREGAPGKSPEEMYIQQKVRVLLMLRKMGSNLTANEEEFLRTYAGVVNSQLSQLPQHSIDQGAEDVVMAVLRNIRNRVLSWSWKIPHTSKQLSPGTNNYRACALEPLPCKRRSRCNEKSEHRS